MTGEERLRITETHAVPLRDYATITKILSRFMNAEDRVADPASLQLSISGGWKYIDGQIVDHHDVELSVDVWVRPIDADGKVLDREASDG